MKRTDYGRNRMALKYLIILIFLAVYLFFGRELGFTDKSPLWTHFTFSFQHGSVIHLIINSFVFISTFRVMERFVRSWHLLLVVYFISVVSSFSAMSGIPTVGSSGMIYAIFGMETVIVIFNNATAKQKGVFFFSIFFMMVVSFFNGSSFMVHMVSFVLGMLFYLVKRKGYFYKHPFQSQC